MNGIAVLRQVLIGNAAVTAVVPETRIIGGTLPLGTDLPAITITKPSGIPLKTITKGAGRFVTDRVQVTVHSPDQVQRYSIIKLVANAGDHAYPIVDGLENVVCTSDGDGPDLVLAEAAIYQISHDFKVSYTEPT